MTKVLITGGSGRFAEFIVKALRGRCDMVLFSRTKPPEDRADLPWVEGDLTIADDCKRAMEGGIDYIQHLGAVPSPSDHPQAMAARKAQGLPDRPLDATMRTNIMGTYYLMQAAVQAGVKAVVMTGSNCAFGHGYRISSKPFPIKYLPLDERHPTDVEDSYSYSKLVGEELLASFTRAYGIRTYVTRPSGICPPARLQRMAETAASVTAWSDWMYAYVPSEDLAELQRMIMDKVQILPAHSVYVANAMDSSCLEPSRAIVAKFRPELLDVTKMTDFQAFWSVAKAQREVGWTPKHSWRDYLHR
jgi:UDP-glucose 4-epimerase